MENFINIKNFHSPKDSMKRVKKQAEDLGFMYSTQYRNPEYIENSCKE